MKCPTCGHENPPGNKFCEIDGTQLTPSVAAGAPLPPVNIPGLDALKGIHWGTIDWQFVRNWAIYNVLALFVFYVVLGIIGAIAYRVALNAAASYATDFLSDLLMGSSSGFGSSDSMGSLVALAWLVGFGLIGLYGLLVGWAQSAMLRGRFPWTNWTSRSVVGAFVAALSVYLFARIGLIGLTDLTDPFLLFVVLGGAFSAVQWYGLRRHVKGAWIWILGNIAAGIALWLFYPMIAGMVGSTAAGGAMDILKGDLSGIVLSLVVPSVIFGGLVTAVTGVAMTYVFQKQAG